MLVSFCISKGDGAKLSGITIVHINYFRYYRVLEYLLNYSAEYSTPKLLVSGSPDVVPWHSETRINISQGSVAK